MPGLGGAAASLCFALVAWPAGLRAQFSAHAEVAPPIAAGSDVDPTASATTIEMEDRPRALETTDEVLLEVPGARRRRSGGFGGFTALSLRGAEAEHTTVLLGDVPLSSADGSAFDLSTVPPWLFDRIEVYRGGAPVWLGAGAIGGVLRLVPRTGRGRRLEAVAGGGSFDLVQGRASASVDDGEISWGTAAGLTSSGGAFPITIDTRPLEPGGLEERTQTNAQLLEAAGIAHARARTESGTFSLVAMGLERTGGVPPPVTRWTPESAVRRSHTRAVIALAGEWLEGGRAPEQADLAAWRAQIVASIGFDRRTLSDPYAQYGQLARETDETVLRSSVRAAGTLRLVEWLDATLVLAGWHEGFDPRDARAPFALGASRRDGGVAALEGRAHGREGQLRWELRPSARIEIVDSELAALRPDLADETRRTDAMPTARLGGVIEVVPGIAVQASVASATRAPSFVELFGDGGLLAGSTELRPEQSTSVDGGLVARVRAVDERSHPVRAHRREPVDAPERGVGVGRGRGGEHAGVRVRADLAERRAHVARVARRDARARPALPPAADGLRARRGARAGAGAARSRERVDRRRLRERDLRHRGERRVDPGGREGGRRRVGGALGRSSARRSDRARRVRRARARRALEAPAGPFGRAPDRGERRLNVSDAARPKAWVSWSSGKDAAWALHVARARGDVEIVGLLTTVSEAFDRVAMHGVRRELLLAQAAATGLPVHVVPLPWPCSNEAYEARMRDAVGAARDAGVTRMIFGDLFLADVRRYREEKLAGTGIEPIFPLWGEPTLELAHAMIDAGVRAHVVTLDPTKLPREFAGRVLDRALLEALPPGVDPCGENGEMHTFVSAGPMLVREIPVRAGEVVEREGFVYADLLPA
jgi:uncharacterized protein (TIGR00290 family)